MNAGVQLCDWMWLSERPFSRFIKESGIYSQSCFIKTSVLDPEDESPLRPGSLLIDQVIIYLFAL